MTSVDEEVRALHAGLLAHWDARDASSYADLFAEDGSLVGFDGSIVDGREAIAAHIAEVFATHPTASYVAIVREVRPLGDVAALLRAVAGLVPPGQQDINPAVNAVQSLVAVRREAGWRAALFQNTPAAFHGRPDLAEALTAELRAELTRVSGRSR